MSAEPPGYHVQAERRATRELQGLQAKHRAQVIRCLQALADDPRPPDSAKLSVMDGYRLAYGEYRVLYTVDDDSRVVTAYRVLRRADGYPA